MCSYGTYFHFGISKSWDQYVTLLIINSAKSDRGVPPGAP